jgi:hypothetical protein
MPAASAAVSEQHDPLGSVGQVQVAIERHRASRDADRVFLNHLRHRFDH